MHAVLDGEADAGRSPRARAPSGRRSRGARRIRRALAACSTSSPACRKAYPPEGLVASVMAQRVAADRGGAGRLPPTFARPRVIGADSREAPDTIPGRSAGIPRFSRQGPYFRSDEMSEQKSGSIGKRKILDRRRHRRGGRGPRDILGNRFPARQQGHGGHDRAGAAVPRAAEHGRRRQAGRSGRRADRRRFRQRAMPLATLRAATPADAGNAGPTAAQRRPTTVEPTAAANAARNRPTGANAANRPNSGANAAQRRPSNAGQRGANAANNGPAKQRRPTRPSTGQRGANAGQHGQRGANGGQQQVRTTQAQAPANGNVRPTAAPTPATRPSRRPSGEPGQRRAPRPPNNGQRTRRRTQASGNVPPTRRRQGRSANAAQPSAGNSRSTVNK